MSTTNIAALRREYQGKSLDEGAVSSDPITQFQCWFDEALRADLPMANAMTLATANGNGKPAARIVLLKGIDHGGFVFYTNYQSRKGRELAENPLAALLFHWVELEREVRIEGVVEKITPAESDAYFASRPLGSRHAAIASPQSEIVPDRATLEARFAAATASGEIAPRPAHWGGYRLIPSCIEFWQGRPNRLHDRLLYSREDARWILRRLAP